MSVRRQRLDAELVRRGLARSREQASDLISSGVVTVSGARAVKPATAVALDAAIEVTGKSVDGQWVSRGAHKLLGALADFAPLGLTVAGRRCLDAGASTGGFTQVLLSQDAREVVAADVGYGQLAWVLQSDSRVLVLDRHNVRELTTEKTVGPVDLTVGDLSFISLRLVLPALVGVTAPEGDLCVMVKPQFEVGKEKVGKGGVVRDVALRAEAVASVASAGEALGWGTRAVTTSKLPGPSGNVEFFLWLSHGERSVSDEAIADEVKRGSADALGEQL